MTRSIVRHLTCCVRLHLLAAIFYSTTLTAQDTQSWTDYDVVYPFANVYAADVETSYQTSITKQEKWRSFGITPTLERAMNPHIDLSFGVPLSFTWQTDTINSAEVTLTLGSRFHFSPNKRVVTRLLVRYEPRFVHQNNLDEWQKSNRLRIRGEIIVPINRKSYYEDNQLYALTDYELFFVKDNAIGERYANRSRVRIGLGYRFSYTLRIELVYIRQQSVNTIEEGTNDRADIVNLKIKHFLNRSKSPKTDSADN